MASTSCGGVAPTLTGEALIRHLPELQSLARVSVLTPFLKPGASLTCDDLMDTMRSVLEALERGASGAVVVQGTDTIDESSFLCDLLYKGEAPVVFTGAMRSASAAGADGPANLLAAIGVAASTQARGLGVLVAMNDEIHLARSVEKMHKGLASAFHTPDAGPIGYVTESQLRILRQPENRFTLPAWPQAMPAVAVVRTGLDDATTLLEAIPRLGYAGLVVEAMGAGHVPDRFASPLASLAADMPVVLASRVMGGCVFRRTYRFPGSEMDLIEKGLIPAGWLSPHKARLLLGACLGCGLDREDIAQAFEQYA